MKIAKLETFHIRLGDGSDLGQGVVYYEDDHSLADW